MKFLLTYLLLGLCFFARTQILLPGFKGGSWWIIQENKNIQLPKSFANLGNFDQLGFAVFETETEMGVIDGEGIIVYSAKDKNVESIGHGLFILTNESNRILFDIKSKEALQEHILDYEVFNESYAHFESKSDSFLFFLPSRKRWTTNKGFKRLNNYHQSIFCRKDSISRSYYSPSGEEILKDNTNRFTYRWGNYISNNKRFAVTHTRFISVPVESGRIKVKNNFLCYTTNAVATLINLENDEVVANGAYDQIFPFKYGGFLVKRNGKSGLLNEELKEVIPPNYNTIAKSGENYHVSNQGLIGLINKDFEPKIPCEFSSIRSDSNFYYTESRSQFKGLYSLDYEKILSTQYTKLVVRDRLVKAYIGDKIRILQLDDEDRIVSDVVLKNAVTAKQTKISGNFIFDRRLAQLGWFYERKAILDTAGVIEKYGYKWGIKNDNDSILAKPKYINPRFVHNAPFTIVTSLPKSFMYDKLKYKVGNTFSLVDYSKGRRVDFNTYLKFKTDDGIKRNFNRCSTTDGNGIFNNEGKFVKLSYVSDSDFELLPHARGGKIVFNEKKCEDCFRYKQWQPVAPEINRLAKADGYEEYFNRYVRLEEAKWNFLDSEGQNKFDEDFTFVNEFYRGTSIVKRKGGWGVVDSDTLIVPCRYSSIKRLAGFEDTVFLVKRNASQLLFLDSNLQEIGNGFLRVKSVQSDLVLMESKNGRGVFYKGELVDNSKKNARLINNFYWRYRSRRMYFVNDASGNELISTTHKPIDVFSDKFLWVENKGKTGLISSLGDTIIPFARQEIRQFPHFYLVYSKYKMELYDLDFNLIRKHKKNQQIVPNLHTAEYALIKKDRIRIYNIEKELLQKWKNKTDKPIYEFANNYFSGKGFFMEDTLVIQIEKGDRHYNFEDGVLALDKRGGMTSFFDKTLTKPLLQTAEKSVSYIGHHTFHYWDFQTGSGYLVKGDKKVSYESNWNAVWSFNDGLCLRSTANSHHYYDTNLVIKLNKYSENAASFNNGFAPVKKGENWTLMNKKGRFVSYPSFDKIEKVGENFYQTKKAPKYGLIDNHGTEIVTCKYDNINIISKNLFQVILNGEMGYINSKGEEVFPIH